MSELEHGRCKPEKKVNVIFWIILLNLAIYVEDHQVVTVASYQFRVCSTIWAGKLVEEEEGSFSLWLSYILTNAGVNVVSWLVLPRNVVFVGASGVVNLRHACDLSSCLQMSLDRRKILEVLILGQFVIEK
ncbi:Rhomboid-like protein 11 chloroplastic, partial [Bienertia sinuspersici]